MICPNCHEKIEPVEETTSSISIVTDKDGQVQTWIEESRDIDGVLISRRVDEYGYIEGGVIDTINQKIYDGEGAIRSDKTLKHQVNGSIRVIAGAEKESEVTK